jgi:Sensors of blue-light using FAD
MLITSSTPLLKEPSFTGANKPRDGWFASLAYRSRARVPQDEQSLNRLIEGSQLRNQAQAITGQLVYDDQRFFQWLEGPADELAVLWDSIKHDSRHSDIEVLGNQQIPARFFGDWSMKLATKNAMADNPKPPGMQEPVLQELIKNVVIPQLAARHLAEPKKTIRPAPHAKVMELAKLLISADANAALQLFEELHLAVPSLNQFYSSVIEPAARCLGDFWKTDQCSEFAVTLGLCRLQTAIRSMGSISPWQASPDGPLKAVLVAPQPGELHMLGAVLDDDILLRAGWQTQCEFPATDEAMQALVAGTWFDALDLSLSVAFSREHWLPRITETIAKARIASCNPELVVVVGGRVFYEQPGLDKAIGANGASSTSLDVGTLIMRELLAATETRH